MWIRLTYSVTTEGESFPSNGETLMAKAALAVAQLLAPGADVLPDGIHGDVFDACAGIKTLTVEVALDSGGSPGAYQSTPYTIAADEIARFALERIKVTT